MQITKAVLITVVGCAFGLLLVIYGVLALSSQEKLVTFHNKVSGSARMGRPATVESLGGPVVVRVLGVGFLGAGIFFLALVLHVFG
jgi:hypothetical protein